MTSYNRFLDGVEFLPPGSDRTPYTPSQLLGRLGVRDAPKQSQRAAVAAWLQENEPTPLLGRFLADDGLIESAFAREDPPQSAA